MVRYFQQDRLIVASHNQGKVREIRKLLGDRVPHVLSAHEGGLEEPEETGKTFEENAQIKALSGALNSGQVCLADDSGLCVCALDGDPGIFSARWAKKYGGFYQAMEHIHGLLASSQDRSAYFICALCMAWPDGHTQTFTGRVDGQLVWPLKGTQGFGYDPMFQPHGYDLTFAQMSHQEKESISHRTKAFYQMIQGCFHDRE